MDEETWDTCVVSSVLEASQQLEDSISWISPEWFSILIRLWEQLFSRQDVQNQAPWMEQKEREKKKKQEVNYQWNVCDDDEKRWAEEEKRKARHTQSPYITLHIAVHTSETKEEFWWAQRAFGGDIDA